MTQDFYQLLDVSPDAEPDAIRRAYREKVKEYHPDLNDHPRAHAQFKVLKKANEVLLDAAERKAYDRLGHEEYVDKRVPGGLPTTDFPRTKRDPEAVRADDRGDDRIEASADAGGTSRERAKASTTASSNSNASAGGGAGAGSGANVSSTPGSSGEAAGSRARRARGGRRRTTRWKRTGRSASARSRDSPAGGPAGAAAAVDRSPDYTISLLWVLVLAGVLPYAAGLAWFAAEHAGAFGRLAAFVLATADDPGALAAGLATDRFGVAPPSAPVEALVAGSPSTLGALLLVGIATAPAAFAIAVWRLRRRTVWNASPAYALAASGPAAGVALNLAGIAVLPLDALAYVVCPFAAVGVFLYRRFRG